jgi:hypothetical protein
MFCPNPQKNEAQYCGRQQRVCALSLGTDRQSLRKCVIAHANSHCNESIVAHEQTSDKEERRRC